MIRIAWNPDEFGELVAIVPALDSHRQTVGYYQLYTQRRPHHCDRGRYLVHIDSRGVDGLDHQESFPRYYFSLETMKSEMEAWVNARETCRRAERRQNGD